MQQQASLLLHAGGGAVYWDYNATVERNLILDWMQGGEGSRCVSSPVC